MEIYTQISPSPWRPSVGRPPQWPVDRRREYFVPVCVCVCSKVRASQSEFGLKWIFPCRRPFYQFGDVGDRAQIPVPTIQVRKNTTKAEPCTVVVCLFRHCPEASIRPTTCAPHSRTHISFSSHLGACVCVCVTYSRRRTATAATAVT